MFESLGEVAWGELEHARGRAEDVPASLEALAGEDEVARVRAKRALWTTLWHQGEVYPASAGAAPFLIELLREGPREERALSLIHI